MLLAFAHSMLDNMPKQLSLQAYFDDYAEAHRTRGNVLTHSLGIPLIVISVLGALAQVEILSAPIQALPLFQIDLGVLAIVAAEGFYLRLDWRLATAFLFALIGLYCFGRVLSLPVNASLFVLGWVLQGLGHGVYEKNKPAFFRSLTHLLIGPLWIFAKVIGYGGYRGYPRE